MPAIAGTAQNPPQPLFIECNGGPFVDQDDSLIKIKASPIFDYDDGNSVQYNYEKIYCDVVKVEDRSPEETDACRTLETVDNRRVDEENLIKTGKEESEEVSTTGTNESEAITENQTSVCPSCSKCLANHDRMVRHFSKTHKSHYRCRKCQYIYESKDILEEHSKVHERKLFHCPSCRNKYKQQSGLERHQIREHSMVEPNPIRNENDDASVKTHRCRYCDNVYLEYSHMVAHERLTHNVQKVQKTQNEFECNVCKKTFDREYSLKRHMRYHERGVFCDMCGKEFASKQSVKLHMRRHMGEKPYKCRICSRSFFDSTSLKMHMRTHTGEKPYVCNVCGNGFTQRSSLMVHHRKHPGNNPPPAPVYLPPLEINSD